MVLKTNFGCLFEWPLKTGFTVIFQIGRSSEDPIDFVVMDTIPGHQRTENDSVTQSTISRFACRILVDRNPPYSSKIFAAGFDSGRNIFLGVSYMGHILVVHVSEITVPPDKSV